MAGLADFAEKSRLRVIRQLSKGWTSYIYLAEDANGRKFALKALREKSNRRQMAGREAANLKLANSAGVGPRLIAADEANGVVSMEYIEGVPFSEWLDSGPQKGQLEKFIEALFVQADELDRIGLDHGQLAGRGRNILVRNSLPVIIDFEKASTRRRCHNRAVIESFLFKSTGSRTVKKVRAILEE